ncbi:MAG: hypothetical protein ABSA18_14665 [Dehalococcoidia bacterium]
MEEEKLDKLVLGGSFESGLCVEVSHSEGTLFLQGYCAHRRKFDRILLTDQEAKSLAKFIQQFVKV